MSQQAMMRVVMALLGADIALNVWLYKRSLDRERRWREGAES